MEVKVVFFEKGLPPFDFYSSAWIDRSIDSSYYHPILLKWSFTNIRLSRSSAFLEIFTFEGNTTVD